MQKIRIKPNDGQVLIKHCVPAETNGKLIIVDANGGKKVDSMQRSIVLAIGNDIKQFKQGDFVYSHIHAGAPIEEICRMRNATGTTADVIRIIAAKDICCSAEVIENGETGLDIIDALGIEEHTQLRHMDNTVQIVKPPKLVLSKP